MTRESTSHLLDVVFIPLHCVQNLCRMNCTETVFLMSFAIHSTVLFIVLSQY